MGDACIVVEGGVTGRVTLDQAQDRVVVEVPGHGGILKLRFANAGGNAVSGQRTLIVQSWPKASLEGATFSPEGSDRVVQLKERGLLSRVAFEEDKLLLSFTEEALSLFACGGLMTLIDYYR